MIKIFNEYLENYWSNDALQHHNELDNEMLMFWVDPNHNVVVPHDKTLDGIVQRETIGEVIRCFDMDDSKGCGKGEKCPGCPIRHLLGQCFNNHEPVTKKIVEKNLNYENLSNPRYFQLTTNFMANEPNKMLVIFDDITKYYEKYLFEHLQNQLFHDYKGYTVDELVQNCLDKAVAISSSKMVVMFVIDPTLGFSKSYFSGNHIETDCEISHCNEMVHRKLWLQCVITKEIVVDNFYNDKKLAQSNDKLNPGLRIKRVLITPMISNDEVIGALMFLNKPEPYTTGDVELVDNIGKRITQLIELKNRK